MKKFELTASNDGMHIHEKLNKVCAHNNRFAVAIQQIHRKYLRLMVDEYLSQSFSLMQTLHGAIYSTRQVAFYNFNIDLVTFCAEVCFYPTNSGDLCPLFKLCIFNFFVWCGNPTKMLPMHSWLVGFPRNVLSNLTEWWRITVYSPHCLLSH